MKYIKTYELSFPFFKRKEVEKNEEPHKPYVKLPVNFLGEYYYDGKLYEIEVGDLTNLGVIKDIKYEPDNGVKWMLVTIDDTKLKFWISNPPEKIYIIKGDEASIAANKYNL